MENKPSWNKVIMHPSLKDTNEELKKFKINLPSNPIATEISFDFSFPISGTLKKVEKEDIYNLNPDNGCKVLNNINTVCAYDESINKFAALEGTAFLTSHSVIKQQGKSDYVSCNSITLYFYTRSKAYSKKSKIIIESDDPEADSKKQYSEDRRMLILNVVPENSVMLIDGPLIGGQMSSYTIKLSNDLLKKNIIPIFFVKNSTSNLVTDCTKELKGNYNSDMHWAYKTLKKGQRSSLFNYTDKDVAENSKIFCYLKAFNVSPQRVEFHPSVYEKYKDKINDLMDLIFYLILVQGDIKNPQVRPIAIAEKYARETLRMTDLNYIMKTAEIVPTMNQERFGWS